MKILKLAAALTALIATPAAAEFELSLYLGSQSVAESTGSGTRPDGTTFSQSFNWEGRSFENPFYYGGRATWWTANNFGFGIEGTHAKAYASAADLAAIGFDRLELSDGHNIITANVMKRWPDAFPKTTLVPYVGAGIGVAIPHVDIQVNGATNRTYDYESTGPAVRGIVGLKYNLNDKWALFSEYQITWSENEITIDPDLGQTPGSLNTDLVTHALNVGLSYSF